MNPSREPTAEGKLARIDQKLEDHLDLSQRRHDRLETELSEFEQSTRRDLDELKGLLIKAMVTVAASAVIYAITTSLAFR